MNDEFVNRMANPTPGARDVQLLTFQLDDREYALDIAMVVRVARMVAITVAPQALESVEGVINVRGQVVPVINLRQRFNLRPKRCALNDRLLITRVGGRTLALIVDTVREVLTVPPGSLERLSNDASDIARYVAAVAKLDGRLLLILNLERVLPDECERP